MHVDILVMHSHHRFIALYFCTFCIVGVGDDAGDDQIIMRGTDKYKFEMRGTERILLT